MKKLFLFFIAITWPVFFLAAQSQTPSSTSNEIELEKTPITIGPYDTGFPRSTYFLEAYYDDQVDIVEIYHDGLGDVNIYIINNSGQIVYHTNTYSSSFTVDTIAISVPDGLYSIIIESDVVYGNGTFLVR